MDKRGFSLAIGAVIVLVLGIIVLSILAFMVLRGSEKAEKVTGNELGAASSASIKQACELSCQSKDYRKFCCEPMTLDNGDEIYCYDSALGITCEQDCSEYDCS